MIGTYLPGCRYSHIILIRVRGPGLSPLIEGVWARLGNNKEQWLRAGMLTVLLGRVHQQRHGLRMGSELCKIMPEYILVVAPDVR